MCKGSNVTVETAHVPVSGSALVAASADCVMVASCAGECSGQSLLINAAAFWGAAINITSSVSSHGGAEAAVPTLTMTSGDLGSVTVSVEGGTVTTGTGRSATQLSVPFPAAGGTLAVTLSFSGAKLTVAAALAVVAKQRAETLGALAAGGKRAAGLDEAFAAMSTVIAWNVNFDP